MRNPPDISTALAAFVTHKANIDTILARRRLITVVSKCPRSG